MEYDTIRTGFNPFFQKGVQRFSGSAVEGRVVAWGRLHSGIDAAGEWGYRQAMKRYPVAGEKVVVVTGASTGIGRATARLLKNRGWRVFPTARSRTDLDLLRGEGFQPV